MANGKLVSWITLWFFFGISGSTVIFSGFVGMIIMILKHQVLSNTLVHSLLISENHTRKTSLIQIIPQKSRGFQETPKL
ncbi:hypothetical protein ES288_A12G067500v1 [Gossypium darwinii]|uniref:Uncharacterized protein n=1 Tax=Gossypium darwinii TaxID=34276 RepID=A0A5D2E6U2_GOSDA|nr:hypothetical protein ES288_A12G067500v1 [Gossypium darwinii]